MNAVVLPIFGAISAGTADFLYKLAQTKGVKAGPFYFVHAGIFAIVVGVYALATSGVQIDLTTLLFSTACAVLSFVSFYSMLISVNRGEASISITTIRLNFFVTAMLAVVFIYESLTSLKVLGLLFAVAAVGLFGWESYAGSHTRRQPYLLWALLAMLALGIRNLVYKVALTKAVDGNSLLVLQALLVFVMTTIFLVRRHIPLPGKTFTFAFLGACLQSTAVILYLEALVRFEASVVTPVQQMSFVVTAFLASMLLNEKILIGKIAGIGCGVMAVLFLGLSG